MLLVAGPGSLAGADSHPGAGCEREATGGLIFQADHPSNRAKIARRGTAFPAWLPAAAVCSHGGDDDGRRSDRRTVSPPSRLASPVIPYPRHHSGGGTYRPTVRPINPCWSFSASVRKAAGGGGTIANRTRPGVGAARDRADIQAAAAAPPAIAETSMAAVMVRRPDRKSTRLNSSHSGESRMPSSA